MYIYKKDLQNMTNYNLIASIFNKTGIYIVLHL